MITTDRDKFIGGHVTEAVKDAMRIEARQRNISMSELHYLFLVDALGKLGYNLPELQVKVATSSEATT